MPHLTARERIGSKLAKKYRLDRILGEGGMGVVFEALDERFDRKVAVKFLHAQYAREPEVVRRFLNEAKAAAKLPGDHVVGVLDFDSDPADDSHYIVLEYLEGESLGDRLDRGPLSPDEAWQALGPVMEVLHHAHTHQIVHRDLKPDNIYLSYNWKGVLVPKVLDFGVAKLMAGSSSGKTAAGMPIGTLTHMAPEQAQGNDVGPWSDVWSMAVVWFQCLTGRLPHDFPEEAPLPAILLHVVMNDPIGLRSVAPKLDPALCAAIDHALTRDRKLRYPTMQAFHADLARLLDRGSLPSASIDRTVPSEDTQRLKNQRVDALASTMAVSALGESAESASPQPGLRIADPSIPSTPIGTVPGFRRLSVGRYAALAAAGAITGLGALGVASFWSGQPDAVVPPASSVIASAAGDEDAGTVISLPSEPMTEATLVLRPAAELPSEAVRLGSAEHPASTSDETPLAHPRGTHSESHRVRPPVETAGARPEVRSPVEERPSPVVTPPVSRPATPPSTRGNGAPRVTRPDFDE